MYRIRLLLIITITWISFIINIEELLEYTSLSFLNINPGVYILLLGIFAVSLALPKLETLTYQIIGSSGITIYVTINVFLYTGNIAIELMLLNMLLELAILVISWILGYELSSWFINYHEGLKESIFRPAETIVDSVLSEIEKIERKISRARRFENELSIIHVNFRTAIKKGVDRRHLRAYLSETLQIIENVGVTNAWHDDNLIICVPAGTESSQVHDLMQNLTYVIQDILNIDSKLHIASFPRDGLVLNDLVNLSTDNDNEQIPVSHPPIFYNIKPVARPPEYNPRITGSVAKIV